MKIRAADPIAIWAQKNSKNKVLRKKETTKNIVRD